MATLSRLLQEFKKEAKESAEKRSAPKKRTRFLIRQRPGPEMSSLASGNSSKAGLPQSFEQINEIIKEASKESKFTAAQEKKAAQLQTRIESLKNELQAALKQAKLVTRARRQVDDLLAGFEAQQALEFALHEKECAVCVDMDAFFAAVECLDAPELKNIPMAVGSSAMLSTANYEARKFGVSAAMPGYIAMKLCPELRIVPLSYEKYQKYSALVAAILTEYDSSLTMFSLDEAFLRLKRGEEDDRPFTAVVNEMRARVKQETGLTCSAGLASNILLAKMASNIKKPDGQFEIPRANVEEMRQFLHAQPVKKISGVGKVMAGLLKGVLGVSTIGELVSKS
jgi:DNA polymerase kappa